MGGLFFYFFIFEKLFLRIFLRVFFFFFKFLFIYLWEVNVLFQTRGEVSVIIENLEGY